MKRLLATLMVAFSLTALAGCATNPATGKSSFTAFMSEQDERRVGAEQHPKLVAAFGGAYNNPKLAAYIGRIGADLARTTETPNLPYTFTILDDEQANAMALPGGYVHITRGILVLASDEAEVAGVLAHELGHITARHSAERYSQGVLANIGATVLGAAGAAAGISAVGDLAGFGAQAYLQSYSRDQELEADRLGMRYMARAGYDPHALVSFFAKLDGYGRLQARQAGDPGAADRSDIMASHPRTQDRIVQAARLASATPVADAKRNHAAYLEQIDGLIYGDNPLQGVRRGREFLHPGLRIAFQVPPSFAMTNTPQRLIARGPGGAIIMFDMETNRSALSAPSAETYLQRRWEGLGGIETLDVNGMDAATGAARVQTQGGVADIRIVAIRETPDRMYRLLFVTPQNMTARLDPELRRTAFSFRRLSADEAAQIRPLRVHIVEVGNGDTVASLAGRMPVSTDREELFRILNGLGRGDTVAAGQKVKIIL